jgi:hypothetical protein
VGKVVGETFITTPIVLSNQDSADSGSIIKIGLISGGVLMGPIGMAIGSSTGVTDTYILSK